jgi:hypothetical protein
MRLAGLLILAAGLLCVIGSIAYMVYSMASAFSAAHEVDSTGGAPAMSLSTTFSIMTAGLVMIIVGIILLAAWNRSSKY